MSVDCLRRDTHRHRARAALRPALGVFVLAAVAAWVIGCGEPQPPVAGSIEDLTVEVGSTESVDLAAYFSDPNEDVLTYTASSSDTSIATVSVSGTTAQVTAVAKGNATVTVNAADPGGLSADRDFLVTVPNRAPVAGEPIGDIEVVVGELAPVDVSGNFRDPDGDALGYTATTSDAGVATAFTSGSVVWVYGVSVATADVTVTVNDHGGLVATQAFTVTVVRSADWGVLEILYDELDGDNWTDNTNWKTDEPLDEWSGVSTEGGRVVALELSENQLTGEVPPELADLSYLETLNLGSNQLTGEIPPELGDLSYLERLQLSGNSLTGAIPPELGGLSYLLYLFLLYNSLTGEIPPELGNLSNLERLELVGNSLTGAIPPELGSLSNLEVLVLDDNSLTGEIPPELGSLSDLEYMSVMDNRLTGEIPPELGNLSNLEYLYLRRNSLTGEIPLDFLNLSSLELLYWTGNDGLCAPDTEEFDDWLDGLRGWGGPRCD